MQNALYKVAGYLRLSREDGDKEESDSIGSQRSIIIRKLEELGQDFELIDYDVNPGDEIWMYNYVKENGYNYAAVKCESNTGDDYSVGFLWSPDSV